MRPPMSSLFHTRRERHGSSTRGPPTPAAGLPVTSVTLAPCEQRGSRRVSGMPVDSGHGARSAARDGWRAWAWVWIFSCGHRFMMRVSARIFPIAMFVGGQRCKSSLHVGVHARVGRSALHGM